MFQDVYRGKKVVIFGHTGFKGVWLSLWLRQLGAEVVGFSDGIPTDPSHFVASGLDQQMTSKMESVSSFPEVQRFIREQEPDFVFHLAAQALVKASYADPVGTFATNALGTGHVLEALRELESPCTAILVTSDKCYENVETYYGYREDDRLGGADPYSASKAAAEIIISSYQRSFFDSPDPVRLGVVRAGNVIGGGDWAADRLVPDIVRSWVAKENVVIRRPQATRPWQHVLEPLSGYLHLGSVLSQDAALHGEAYNFGPPAGAVSPVRDVVSSLEKYLSGLEVTIDESQANFHEAGLLKLCCDKALSQLGWRPVLDFSETMGFTGEWYNRFYVEGEKEIVSYSEKQLDMYQRLAFERGCPWAGES